MKKLQKTLEFSTIKQNNVVLQLMLKANELRNSSDIRGVWIVTQLDL